MVEIPEPGSSWLCTKSFQSECTRGSYNLGDIYKFIEVASDDDFRMSTVEEFDRWGRNDDFNTIHAPGSDIYPRELKDYFVEATPEKIQEYNEKKKSLRAKELQVEQKAFNSRTLLIWALIFTGVVVLIHFCG